MSHPDFTTLEKEALQELTVQTLNANLLTTFKKLHREQLEVFELTLGGLEKTCQLEVQRAVEKHIRKQLEENFQNLELQAQSQVNRLVSPILTNAAQNINRL